MYEDSWYTLVPEAHGKQDDGHQQKLQHRRRESLLKQPSDANHAATGPSDTLSNLLEEVEAVKGPPTATVSRRAKSYSDFYCVARAQIRKDTANLKGYHDGEPMASKISAKCRLAFEEMYETHEDELLDASQEEFHVYGDQLALSIRHLDGLLHDTSAALDLLASLSVSFKTVEGQTTAFQAQCEDVLVEQKHIKLLSNEVADGLQHYAYLEPITRRLNAPGASSVIGDEGFLEMMTNLDECIEFMIKNPEHRDSEIYLARYQSLLGRVLALIVTMFSKSIQASAVAAKAAEIQRRGVGRGTITMTDVYIYQAPQSSTEVDRIHQSLRYISVNANKAIEMGIRESKLKGNPQPEWRAIRDHLTTYERQLNEMTDIYVNIRKRAIPDYVDLLLSKTVAVEISPYKEFDRYARECINLALEICKNEHAKYLTLFCGNAIYPTGVEEPRTIQLTIEKGKFRAFLYEIADIVYKLLKDQLQQIDMTSVVNLAIWLNERSYYPTSSDEVLSSHADDEEDEVSQEQSSKVMAQVSGDINSMIVRLAFRLVRESLFFNVEKYTAKSTDLTYSQAGLENLSSPMSQLNLSDQPSQPKPFHERLMEDEVRTRVEKALGPGFLEAYVPVRTACGLLLYIHDLSFEHDGESLSSGIAYEVIHETCTAIKRAAEQVTAKFSRIDGQIFSIKNLVLLKNLVLAYEIAGSRRASALDFKNIWITFAELRNRGGLFDISSYYRLLASGSLFPKVVESVQDARVELDGLLRQNITMFCEESASLVMKGDLSGRRGVATAEEQIKKKLLHSHPNEEQLRNTLWEAVMRLVEEKKKSRNRPFEE